MTGELPLRDIHLPESVSYWPLAPGWWLLILLLLALLIGMTLSLCYYYKRHKQQAYRKEALQQLAHAHQHYQRTPSTCQASITATMLMVLKRTAITAYPNKRTRTLHGQAWVDFLNQQTPTPYFCAQLSEVFCKQQYCAANEHTHWPIEALYCACQHWVKHHKGALC